jgi:hypothetical protein
MRTLAIIAVATFGFAFVGCGVGSAEDKKVTKEDLVKHLKSKGVQCDLESGTLVVFEKKDHANFVIEGFRTPEAAEESLKQHKTGMQWKNFTIVPSTATSKEFKEKATTAVKAALK